MVMRAVATAGHVHVRLTLNFVPDFLTQIFQRSTRLKILMSNAQSKYITGRRHVSDPTLAFSVRHPLTGL